MEQHAEHLISENSESQFIGVIIAVFAVIITLGKKYTNYQ
jgi:hypothetical protein